MSEDLTKPKYQCPICYGKIDRFWEKETARTT